MQQTAKMVQIIDDDPVLRKVAQLTLSDAFTWADVHCYGAANSAIQALNDLSPDLILLDLVMPVMDGHEALPLLRAGSSSETKILIATATQLSEKMKSDLVNSGADGFILKPYQPKGLIERLRPHLEAKTAPQPNRRTGLDGSDLNRAFAVRLNQVERAVTNYLHDFSNAAASQGSELEGLRDKLHTLAGSAALFDMSDIGDMASEAEAALIAFQADLSSHDKGEVLTRALTNLNASLIGKRS